MATLQARTIDALIAQLLERVGEHARVVAPSDALTALDTRYVGPLRRLLEEAFPGVPETAFYAVRDDLVVVQRGGLSRAAEDALVGYAPGMTLRVARASDKRVRELHDTYGDALSVLRLTRTRHLETDLRNPVLQLGEAFFRPRSIPAWARVTVRLAQLCQALARLKSEAGLAQANVFHEGGDYDTTLVPCELLGQRHGEAQVLALSDAA